MVTWKLDDLYDFSKTDSLIHKLKKLADEFISKKDLLTDNISVDDFKSFILISEKMVDISSRLGGYAELWLSENTSDSQRNSHNAKLSEGLTDISNTVLFFNLWFKKLPDKDANRIISACPEYEYMLNNSRKFKDYTLEEREEQIVNLKDLTGGEALINMYDIVTNRFRWDFQGQSMSQEVITQFYRNFDPEVRKSAYTTVLTKYGDEESVLGELYKNLSNDWRNENVKLRGFKSPINVRNIGNDIPDKAVENLLKVTRRNIGIFKEYFQLKSRILGIDKPSRFDIYAPKDKIEKEYTYDGAKELVLDTYKEFSEDMYNHAKKIFDDEHVHSELTDNKRSGAFCYTVQNDISPYILLNFTNKQDDVFTMMHEIGHGIHGLLASVQNKFNFHATLPLAETASIFGENILMRKFLNEADDKEKVSLLMNALDKAYGSIIRQSYFVIFEEDAHEAISKGATIDELNDLYMKNLKEQFQDAIEIPEVFKHEWKYIPHIFHTPFYCYAYAFGNLLVLALLRMYEEQGEKFVPKFLKILTYGGSKAPDEILKEVGIDITKEEFWQGGYDILQNELEALKELVN